LIPVLALEELGKVMAYGAEKYGEHNWSEHAGRWAWTQLVASSMRHIYAWLRREDLDKESGLPHLAHAMANLAMLLDLVLLKQGKDDRNPVYPPFVGVDELPPHVASSGMAGSRSSRDLYPSDNMEDRIMAQSGYKSVRMPKPGSVQYADDLHDETK
jgi:hypothetical protein